MVILAWLGSVALLGGPAPRGGGGNLKNFGADGTEIFDKLLFLGILGYFWAKNTSFDRNWSSIITLGHFWAKISDFVALSKKNQKILKIKILGVIFWVKSWPKNSIKRKNMGLQCVFAAPKAPRKNSALFWPFWSSKIGKFGGWWSSKIFRPPNTSDWDPLAGFGP